MLQIAKSWKCHALFALNVGKYPAHRAKLATLGMAVGCFILVSSYNLSSSSGQNSNLGDNALRPQQPAASDLPESLIAPLPPVHGLGSTPTSQTALPTAPTLNGEVGGHSALPGNPYRSTGSLPDEGALPTGEMPPGQGLSEPGNGQMPPARRDFGSVNSLPMQSSPMGPSSADVAGGANPAMPGGGQVGIPSSGQNVAAEGVEARSAALLESFLGDQSGGPIAPMTYVEPAQQNAMNNGTYQPGRSRQDYAGSNGGVDSSEIRTDEPLPLKNAIERQYASWWRDKLSKAEVEGNFLEVHQILRQVPMSSQPEVLCEYWQLAKSIVALEIRREGLQMWKQVGGSQNSQPIYNAVHSTLESELSLAQAEVRQAQLHFARLTQRFGMGGTVRPADSPYIGPYSTRQSEMSLGDSQYAVLAAEIEKSWEEINRNVQDLQWAESQWQNSASRQMADATAATFQLRQRYLLVLNQQVTGYNEKIARYALGVGGFSRSTEQRLAMLLRQPIVGGVVMDTRTDALFRGLDTRITQEQAIAQVSYEGRNVSGGNYGSVVSANGLTPVGSAPMQGGYVANANGLQPQYRMPTNAQGSVGGSGRVLPSNANAWNSASLGQGGASGSYYQR